MKKYAYFPGCSLEKMARSYHESAMAATRALDIELEEIEDWNCCGATTYFHIDELLAHTLCARNLALAEKLNADVVAPCSGCYKNLYSTRKHMMHEPDLAQHINDALAEDDLKFAGTSQVRHLLDVMVRDVGVEEIKKRVRKPLTGLKVAPYYGCQILRPRKDHEDIERPQFFEELLSAIGADPVDYLLKARCCGGALLITNRTAALSMVRNLLENAVQSGAAMIVTACPLCQVNLECYQTQVNSEFGTNLRIPVLYFTQLVGLALGIAPGRLGIGSELVSVTPALASAASGAGGGGR
jgi:heterodisulfide reductase subunit B